MDLREKLQLKGERITLLNASVPATDEVAAALPGVAFTPDIATTDGVLLFAANLAELQQQAAAAVPSLKPDALFWVVYPKGGSAAKRDLNRDTLWKVLEPFGWRPVRQVSIDDTWTALRFRPGKMEPR